MQYKKYSQEEIFALNKQLGDKLPELLDHFHLTTKLTFRSKMWVGKCPVHGGDNDSAFNIYHRGSIVGNWYCRTHQCEKIFKATLIGFVRGLLSRQNGWKSLKDKDKIYSFGQTLKYIEDFLGGKAEKINEEEYEKNKFVNTFRLHERNGHTKFSRTYIRTKLKIPAQYYIDRGYLPETLDKYDVGLCDDETKPFYNRIVIPVYSDDYSCIVGYTARSIFNVCDKCGLYHSLSKECPQKEEAWKHAKWLNNKDFSKQDYLYNYWFARDEIRRTGVVVLVEGPGDVWKLVENGIKNAVGLFGTVLTDSQKFILDCSSASAIFVMGDNDQPGENAAKEIIEKCQKLYRVEKFDWQGIAAKDVGEMSNELVQEKIGGIVNRLSGLN